MKRKVLVLLSIAAALVAAILVSGLACSSVRTAWAVRSFSRGAGEKAVQLYAPDVKRGDRLAESLRAIFQTHGNDGQLLITAYEIDQFQFRFVVNQKPTPEHQALRDVLANELHAQGIDGEPYQLEKINGAEKDLNDSLRAIETLREASIADPESKALSEAMTAAAVDDVSPAGIFNFVTRDGNQGKFPNLQELVAKLRAAAEKRDDAILRLEAGDAENLLHLYREMGMKNAEWPKTWTGSKGNIAAVFKQFTPARPNYVALLKELARYREIAKQPAPPFLTAQIKRGATGQAVSLLQQRLQLEGYWGGPINGKFDEALEQTVKLYQDDRQVTSDGKIEKVTLDRLNVPIPERVKQIKLALHKLRQTDSRGEDYFVRVNIGAQELEVYTDGGMKLARKHRIVCGSQVDKNHTPLFSSEITEIIFYPPWNVPQRIIKEEMLKEYLKDDDYFEKHGYEAKIQYNKDGDFDKIVSVTQPPGVGNALGVVKINFPNKYDVYLHDTNQKNLFSRSLRTFSHGCMRVHHPLDLVRFLLERDKNEYAEQVDRLVERQVSHPVELKHHVPIHIEYCTVGVNEQGKAVFFTDAYDMDKEAMLQMTAE